MRRYLVPVVYEITGEITVEAASKAEALQQAKDQWQGPKTIEAPCIEVQWPPLQNIYQEDDQ